MQKLRWLAVLMVVTILVITGFQLHWLINNYSREEKTLEMKSEIAFNETINKLQAAKLNIGKVFQDSLPGKMRVMINKLPEPVVRMRVAPKEDVVTMVNVLREKLKTVKSEVVKSDTFSSLTNKTTILYRHDSPGVKSALNLKRGDQVFQFLYGVDSLQDSVKIQEIQTAYAKALQKEKIDIPYSISRREGFSNSDGNFNEITLGYAKPVTYRLQLGNTFPYLIKRLAAPILFSLFLVGVTILSFVLLYRTLWKQKKLADLKNDFISNITHELKTPIATVGVAIEAMKNFNAMQNPQRTKEYLDISEKELQRLSLLVDKVLKLSMFEKKEAELKFEDLNMQEVVNEVVSSMRLQFEKNNATVSVITSGDLTLQGDKLHLVSVVFNLLDNAVKYSRNNPEIKIDLKEQDENIVMRIADNGIGIDAAYRDKVFEKFFRVPAGNTHNSKGYGLGLSYSAHVIKQHNGKIGVESNSGEGSTFTITLPKAIA